MGKQVSTDKGQSQAAKATAGKSNEVNELPTAAPTKRAQPPLMKDIQGSFDAIHKAINSDDDAEDVIAVIEEHIDKLEDLLRVRGMLGQEWGV